MLFLERNPVIVNLSLSFMIAITSGLWTGYFAGSSAEKPMEDRYHILIIISIVIFFLQVWYNYYIYRPNKKSIYEILNLGVHFFVAHADKPVDMGDFRGFVHLCVATRPGPKEPRQRCLVPRYISTRNTAHDTGPIPIDDDDHRAWYINVKAFHSHLITCGEPNPAERPRTNRFYVRSADIFDRKSIISVPIWSKSGKPVVIGVLTFDATHSLADLDWMKDSTINKSVDNMLKAMSELIGKILSDDKRD